MTTAATGSAVVFALGTEPRFGVPGTVLTAYDPILPISAGLVPAETDSPQVNRSGFLLPGIPAAVTGPVEWSLPFAPDLLLEYLFHLTGSVVKDSPEADVYRYVFEPAGPDTFIESSFFGLVGKEPVDRQWLYGLRFGSLEATIGSNTPIPVKLTGVSSHGTRLSNPRPDLANIGTYALDPHLRGPLALKSDGDYLHVQVTHDVAGGGLQFQTHHGGPTPDVWSPPAEVVYDADGQARWQNLVNQFGWDLGYWSTNKDPLEILWPGEASDHADLAVGDTFVFKVRWTTPALATLAPRQSFTSAHWAMRFRPAGSTAAYLEAQVDSGALKIENAIDPRAGNGSRYVHSIHRPGPFRPSLTFQRAFVDRTFGDLLEGHAPLDLVTEFLGKQIGTNAFRESLSIRFPSASLAKADSPISGPGIVNEDVELVGKTDDAGNAPITVTLVSERDWAP